MFPHIWTSVLIAYAQMRPLPYAFVSGYQSRSDPFRTLPYLMYARREGSDVTVCMPIL